MYRCIRKNKFQPGKKNRIKLVKHTWALRVQNSRGLLEPTITFLQDNTSIEKSPPLTDICHAFYNIVLQAAVASQSGLLQTRFLFTKGKFHPATLVQIFALSLSRQTDTFDKPCLANPNVHTTAGGCILRLRDLLAC